MNLRQISSTDTVQKVVNDYNLNMQDIQANASLLSGITLTSDLDGFAEALNHAEVKLFMTLSTYNFGAGSYFAVGFAATRWAMRFIVAFASNNKIYMRYKANESSPWTDWEER